MATQRQFWWRSIDHEASSSSLSRFQSSYPEDLAETRSKRKAETPLNGAREQQWWYLETTKVIIRDAPFRPSFLPSFLPFRFNRKLKGYKDEGAKSSTYQLHERHVYPFPGNSRSKLRTVELAWITNNARRLTVFAFAYELAELLPRTNRRTTTFRPFFAELSRPVTTKRGCITPPPSGLTVARWIVRITSMSESIGVYFLNFHSIPPSFASSLRSIVGSSFFFFFFFLNYASFNLKGSKTRRPFLHSTLRERPR